MNISWRISWFSFKSNSDDRKLTRTLPIFSPDEPDIRMITVPHNRGSTVLLLLARKKNQQITSQPHPIKKKNRSRENATPPPNPRIAQWTNSTSYQRATNFPHARTATPPRARCLRHYHSPEHPANFSLSNNSARKKGKKKNTKTKKNPLPNQPLLAFIRQTRHATRGYAECARLFFPPPPRLRVSRD